MIKRLILGWLFTLALPSLCEAREDWVERKFTFTAGQDSSCSQNCLELSSNGGNYQQLGCNQAQPGCHEVKLTTPKTISIRVMPHEYNQFSLRMTSLSERGGKRRIVFDSTDVNLITDFSYHINRRTDHFVDLWINDNDDDDFKDFHAQLEGPQTVFFGIDYLAAASCPGDAPDSSHNTFTFLSPVVGEIPIGLNGVTFQLENRSSNRSSDNLNVLATIDIYVPSLRRVLNHRVVRQNELRDNSNGEFELHYFNTPSYGGIQYRLCTYGNDAIKVKGISTDFETERPFTYGNQGLGGARPIDPNPNLSGVGIISVNLSDVGTQKSSMNGMMIGLVDQPNPRLPKHGSLPSPEKVAEMLRPLNLSIWRVFPTLENPFEYAKALGVPIVVDLMQLGKEFSNKVGEPYAHPKQWSDWVAKLIHSNRGYTQYIDVWNEPEVNKFWSKKNTPDELFAIYRGAALGLRKSGETNIKIGGPSLNNYNPAYLTASLDYALKHNLEVNFLGWHELKSAEADLSLIEAHLKDARSRFMNPANKKYESLHIQELQINESLSQKNVTYPGDRLATLFYLERGGASQAAQDCWFDTNGFRMARDGSICGLFMRPEKGTDPSTWYQPRNSYWAEKSYADTLGKRIPCSSTNKNIVCFAGAMDANTQEAKVVVGYYGTVYSFKDANVEISLIGIGSDVAPDGLVHVKLERIPTANEIPMPQLPLIKQYVARPKLGKLLVRLPKLAIHEGAVLTLKPILSYTGR